MKKVFWILSIAILSCTVVQAQDQYNDNPPPQQQNDDVYYQNNNYDESQGDNSGMSYQTFYDQLSPYGTWINYPGRGYVWIPQTNGDFSPYETDGHWVYTDYGWTWASDYDWGWAAFHYGRWFQDPSYGWAWSPGYEWAPAWVTWGEYGGYYCWAPLGYGERVGGRYGDRHWYFANKNYIADGHIQNHIVDRDVVNHQVGAGGNIHVIEHANTYNHSVFNAGPKAQEVSRAVGHTVEPVHINNVSQPGKTRVEGGAVSIYRPAITHSATPDQQKAVPKNLSRPEDVHPANNAINNHGGGANPNTNNRAINQGEQHSTPTPQNNQPNRSEPRSDPSPPRQSVPRQDNSFRNDQPMRSQPSEPMRSEPSRPSGGFVPSERPVQQSAPMRSAPAPSFHASPAPMGGGGFHGGGGGGRHK